MRGEQGMSERNLIRYLLALEVFLKTEQDKGPELFMKRAAIWFNETEKYALQLHEVSRADYLEAKRREYQNQRALQFSLNN